MRKIVLIWLLCLFGMFTYGATKTSSKTVYVGSTFTINPVSLCEFSTSKAMSGVANFPSGNAFAVANSYHSVQLAGTSTNGLKGGYNTYEVTALTVGTYTITGGSTICTEVGWSVSISGTSYYAKKTDYNSFTLTVTVKPVPKVTQIVIPSTHTMTVGESYTFSPIIVETGASTTLTWHSSNTSVATIDSNGILTTKGVGTVNITCTASNGVSAQCLVTVNPILASNITMNEMTAELVTGESLQIHASIEPATTTNKGISWSSTNSSIAIVDGNGLVTAIAPGNCNIVAKTSDGSNLTTTCAVKVLSDVLYVDDAVGVPSGTIVLPIQLKNVSPITGLQFEMQLPEGVTIVDNGTSKITPTTSDRIIDHTISGAKLSNGNYQFIVFSGTSAALRENEGAIAYVTLNVGENMAIGDYTIGIKEVELTKTDGTSLYHKDMNSKLTLTEAIIGDVNGDGKVTITDAVGIVNHVLHRTPSSFITKAADVNGDENITISDAVKVVNIVLNK